MNIYGAGRNQQNLMGGMLSGVFGTFPHIAIDAPVDFAAFKAAVMEQEQNVRRELSIVLAICGTAPKIVSITRRFAPRTPLFRSCPDTSRTPHLRRSSLPPPILRAWAWDSGVSC